MRAVGAYVCDSSQFHPFEVRKEDFHPQKSSHRCVITDLYHSDNYDFCIFINQAKAQVMVTNI